MVGLVLLMLVTEFISWFDLLATFEVMRRPEVGGWVGRVYRFFPDCYVLEVTGSNIAIVSFDFLFVSVYYLAYDGE